MMRRTYARIWPLVFLALGFYSVFGGHLHFEIAGTTIMGHDLMWFLMALAHADVLLPGSSAADGCSCHRKAVVEREPIGVGSDPIKGV